MVGWRMILRPGGIGHCYRMTIMTPRTTIEGLGVARGGFVDRGYGEWLVERLGGDRWHSICMGAVLWS